MNRTVIFIRDVNVLGNLDIGEDVALLFDDVSLSNKTREERIHYFDLENDSQLRVLYGIANIPARVPRAFTTNSVDRITGESYMSVTPEEITRRITVIKVTKSLKLCLKKTTTLTEEIEIISKKG